MRIFLGRPWNWSMPVIIMCMMMSFPCGKISRIMINMSKIWWKTVKNWRLSALFSQRKDRILPHWQQVSAIRRLFWIMWSRKQPRVILWRISWKTRRPMSLTANLLMTRMTKMDWIWKTCSKSMRKPSKMLLRWIPPGWIWMLRHFRIWTSVMWIWVIWLMLMRYPLQCRLSRLMIFRILWMVYPWIWRRIPWLSFSMHYWRAIRILWGMIRQQILPDWQLAWNSIWPRMKLFSIYRRNWRIFCSRSWKAWSQKICWRILLAVWWKIIRNLP